MAASGREQNGNFREDEPWIAFSTGGLLAKPEGTIVSYLTEVSSSEFVLTYAARQTLAGLPNDREDKRS